MELIVVAADVVIVVLAAWVLASQPRSVWSAAAEHSRPFWLVWATVFVAIGAVPVITGALEHGAAAVWLTVWCAIAALQPAMWFDVLEVRRDVARRRRALLDKRGRDAARDEAEAIRWHDE